MAPKDPIDFHERHENISEGVGKTHLLPVDDCEAEAPSSDCFPRTSSVREAEPAGLDLDPWKHRSTGMKCKTCMWSVMKETARMLGQKALGRCRRHSPTMSGYPAIFEDDWCGDHKLDENKL